MIDQAGSTTQVKEGSSVIASMRYLGLGTLVGLNYDEAADLNLTYQNGGSGDAGDPYTGLDRFGRIVETIWIKGSSDVVQAVYGRNRASGILWRRDDEASSTIAMDALYEYDGLQQVTAWKRGNLSPSGGPPYTGVSSKKQGEDFTYDQTGNWLGDVSDNPNFTQSRTHNKANQITSITGPSGVIQPAYDTVGNMTVSPSPGAWNTAYAYKWDAWNRLVEIKQGTTVVGAYAYDALTRRTRKTVGGVTRDIYYDRQWRSVEEREGSTVKVQHTWSPFDRWTLLRRKRNASGSTLNETLFCLRDYLDPVALANTSGNVVERYNYDAFGTVRIMNASFNVRGSSNYDWSFLYHGEFIDDESGLYNYGYRYYDAQLGRWISRDPLGEQGGLNLYGFTANNSPNKIDDFGLCTITIDVGHGGLRTSRTTQRANDRTNKLDEDDCQRFVSVGCGSNFLNNLYNKDGIGIATYPVNDTEGGSDSDMLQRHGRERTDLCPVLDLSIHVDKAVEDAKAAAYQLCLPSCCCESVTIKITCENSLTEPGDITSLVHRCGEIINVTCS